MLLFGQFRKQLQASRDRLGPARLNAEPLLPGDAPSKLSQPPSPSRRASSLSLFPPDQQVPSIGGGAGGHAAPERPRERVRDVSLLALPTGAGGVIKVCVRVQFAVYFTFEIMLF